MSAPAFSGPQKLFFFETSPHLRRRGNAYFQRTASCVSRTNNGARGQVKRVREEKFSSIYTFRQSLDAPTHASIPKGKEKFFPGLHGRIAR